MKHVGVVFFFFNDTATTEIYTLSLHDALPIWIAPECYSTPNSAAVNMGPRYSSDGRSEEHTSELQSRQYLVCRLLLEKKKNQDVVIWPCDLFPITRCVYSHAICVFQCEHDNAK